MIEIGGGIPSPISNRINDTSVGDYNTKWTVIFFLYDNYKNNAKH